MGAWDVGVFDNDQALDWVANLGDRDDLSLIEEALAVDPAGGELDASAGTDVLAAAEVVAALIGKPSKVLPEEVTAWVAAHSTLKAAPLVPKARLLVNSVLSERSELRILWEENQDESPKWKAAVADLMARLN